MKRLLISITAEEERDLPPMLLHMAAKFRVLFSLGMKECPIISETGFIYWTIERSEETDMTNLTLIEKGYDA